MEKIKIKNNLLQFLSSPRAQELSNVEPIDSETNAVSSETSSLQLNKRLPGANLFSTSTAPTPPPRLMQSASIFAQVTKIDGKENEPNSIKILRLLDATGKCNRHDFALVYEATYGITISLALSEIGKLEKSGKIMAENPEPQKTQSKHRTIVISESGIRELNNPSYLKTRVTSSFIPGTVNLTSGLLALLEEMGKNGVVNYLDFMAAANKQFGYTQHRTTLSGRLTNLRLQSGYLDIEFNAEGKKIILLTEKGKNKLASVRAEKIDAEKSDPLQSNSLGNSRSI